MPESREVSNRTALRWAWRNRQLAGATTPVGELVTAQLARRPPPDRPLQAAITQLLHSYLPAPLAEHCMAGPLRAGRLTIYVDCPTRLYELDTCWTSVLRVALEGAALPAQVRSVVFRLGGCGPA